MVDHYNCGGQLIETNGEAYECRSCGAEVRASVVDRHESFERVAESGEPASDVAKAALEGSD